MENPTSLRQRLIQSGRFEHDDMLDRINQKISNCIDILIVVLVIAGMTALVFAEKAYPIKSDFWWE